MCCETCFPYLRDYTKCCTINCHYTEVTIIGDTMFVTRIVSIIVIANFNLVP